jgi:penicillin-binding protein 1A
MAMGEAHTIAAQQYFPQYRIDNKTEIALREYDLAAKALEADQRSLTAAAGIAVFFAGSVTTLIGASSGLSGLTQVLDQFGTSLEIAFSGMVFAVTGLAMRYFALLQRSATYASRKIVVLRRLLGIDYGHIETVLPSERLDGANEPFAIRMFPGWLSLPALPVIAITLLAGVAQSAIYVAFRANGDSYLRLFDVAIMDKHGQLSVATGLTLSLLILAIYRLSLLDDFESVRLYLTAKVAKLIRCPLKDRIGHVLYRMQLSVFEARRLGIDLTKLHPMLVAIEDRRHFKHGGNSLAAIAAAGYRYARYGTRSGGSTIYQQLARSNFIARFDSSWKRKILEWLLAPWLNERFSKQECLDAYLCSVRFSHGVIGLPAAIKHFFPKQKLDSPLNHSQIFFLIERLSNISATFPQHRVQRLVDNAIASGVLTTEDVPTVNAIYKTAGTAKLINLKGAAPALHG